MWGGFIKIRTKHLPKPGTIWTLLTLNQTCTKLWPNFGHTKVWPKFARPKFGQSLAEDWHIQTLVEFCTKVCTKIRINQTLIKVRIYQSLVQCLGIPNFVPNFGAKLGTNFGPPKHWPNIDQTLVRTSNRQRLGVTCNNGCFHSHK